MKICYTASVARMDAGYAGEAIDNEKSFEVYPNPVSDFLNFNTAENITSAIIYDINGRTVKSVNLEGSKQISVRELPQGIYMVQVNDQGKISTQRFIKNYWHFPQV